MNLMSLLDSLRSQLQRERAAAANDRKDIADVSRDAVRKRESLGRTNSPSRQKTLLADMQRLDKKRAAAEKSLATSEKKIVDLMKRVAAAESAEQDKAAKAQTRAAKAQAQKQAQTERRLRDTADAVTELEGRVTGIEDALLARVHEDIAHDPVAREHDVFLSGLDVWSTSGGVLQAQSAPRPWRNPREERQPRCTKAPRGSRPPPAMLAGPCSPRLPRHPVKAQCAGTQRSPPDASQCRARRTRHTATDPP